MMSIADFELSADPLSSGYLEGLAMSVEDRRELSLADAFPGIFSVFEHLVEDIERIKDQNDSFREFPVAAGVYRKTKNGLLLVSHATNIVNQTHDSTAHAEITALRAASEKLSDKHLSNHVLVTTLEPCYMCAGACIHTGISDVVYMLGQNDIKDRRVYAGKEHKKFRTNDGIGASTKAILKQEGINVYGGYRKKTLLEVITFQPVSMRAYYNRQD